MGDDYVASTQERTIRSADDGPPVVQVTHPKQAQVNLLQTQMQDQLSRADALIASMEQQYTYMSDLFQAQQTANQQYSTGM